MGRAAWSDRMRRMHSLKEAARRAGISEELLSLWVATKRIKPAVNTPATALPVPGRPGVVREDFVAPAFCAFDDRNIEQIRALAEKPESKPRRKAQTDSEFLTVAQVAERWGLSPDTITRLFADEPGVIALGKEHPRGKRRRVTLRIPVEVVERVKRKRAKK
jgi:AraC-like DNA-binding protein